MKRAFITISVLLVAAAVLWVLEPNVFSTASSTTQAATKAQYRCPMHPSFTSDQPGTCSICGMELVHVHAPGAAQTSPLSTSAIQVSPAQQQALGLTTAAVEPREFQSQIHFTGHISFPPAESILAPAAGKVTRAFASAVNGVAVHVHAGDPLLVFSAPDAVTIRAPKPAAIQSLAAEGAQIPKGAVLCLFVDLSRLTILGDVGGVDLSSVRSGRSARISIPSHPGKVWNGKLVDIYQQFNERLQTLTVKLEAPNDSIDLWQGMLATIEIHSSLGNRLSIPEDAVSPGDGYDIVFVAKSATVFEPRKVQLGIRSGHLREVTRGLQSGERVVESASFFLDSESRLNAAATMRSTTPAAIAP